MRLDQPIKLLPSAISRRISGVFFRLWSVGYEVACITWGTNSLVVSRDGCTLIAVCIFCKARAHIFRLSTPRMEKYRQGLTRTHKISGNDCLMQSYSPLRGRSWLGMSIRQQKPGGKRTGVKNSAPKVRLRYRLWRMYCTAKVMEQSDAAWIHFSNVAQKSYRP
jgi:hypothetical protein